MILLARNTTENAGPEAREGRIQVAAHLNALLVALEEISTRVPGTVSLEKLLGKPAIEALIVLSLHISASLSYAVHGDGCSNCRRFMMSSYLNASLGVALAHYRGREGKKCGRGRYGWLFEVGLAGAKPSPPRRIFR